MANKSLALKAADRQEQDFSIKLPSIIDRLNLIADLGELEIAYLDILEDAIGDLEGINKALYSS